MNRQKLKAELKPEFGPHIVCTRARAHSHARVHAHAHHTSFQLGRHPGLVHGWVHMRESASWRFSQTPQTFRKKNMGKMEALRSAFFLRHCPTPGFLRKCPKNKMMQMLFMSISAFRVAHMHTHLQTHMHTHIQMHTSVYVCGFWGVWTWCQLKILTPTLRPNPNPSEPYSSL